MTPEQRELAAGLIVLPPKGQRRVSKEQFAQGFPGALVDNKLSLKILSQAFDEKSAEDLRYAIIIGGAFGFSSEHKDVLSRLSSADWHVSHEDIVMALVRGNFQDDATADALYAATQFVPEYLKFDDCRALAVNAIWGLGKISGKYSEGKLALLANSPDPVLRQAAEYQLNSIRPSYDLQKKT
jgi:hypothetical protein